MKLIFFITYLFAFFISIAPLPAQTNMLGYAGNAGSEVFNDAIQLSNGNMLIVGAADNLDWVDVSIPRIQLAAVGITNNLSTNKFCFILILDSNLANIKQLFYLPQGAAENFRFVKNTHLVGLPTGDMYISGNTEGSGNTGGYFIGKLNGNFVQADPTGFSWIHNVYAKAGTNPKVYQPWDVGSDGKVVFAYGDSHDYDWSAIYRLKADGTNDVVANWRLHYTTTGAQYLGDANAYAGGIGGIAYSAIVFKRDGSRCELRSTNTTDYNTWYPDGNGGTKKGKWPLDVLFNSACVPGGSNATNGPGYTGYSPSSIFTYGPSSICIDKRNNHLYIGFNAQSKLPDGNPDFEPAVMAMDETGNLKWWSRLYHEKTPAGLLVNSTPDQYIDALAIDYSKPENMGMLVVAARCHGNNTTNFWNGNNIAANPSASGFQNGFTGSSGNIHVSYLAKLTLAQGVLMHSTYMGELADNATGLGSPSTDPNLDGWPSPNAGFPTLNTTYIGKNNVKVTADGSVLVLGVGRRTITTANAYQKMVKPADGSSAWNNFVRLYSPNLSTLKYSSLVAGAWDVATGANGDNVKLYGILKTNKGIIALGLHTGSGGQMPVANVPAWASNVYNASSAVVAYYQSTNMADNNDNGYVPNGPLPVRIINLKGSSANAQNVLSWQTLTERNNRGFYLQKSRDGTNFSNCYYQPTKANNGNSSALLAYTQTDYNTLPGNTYYRLQQVDINGKETFSETILLTQKANNLQLWALAYPNPVSTQLHIELYTPTTQNLIISVLDKVGRKLWTKQGNVAMGFHYFNYPTQQLPAGSYLLQVQNDGGTILKTQKLLKIK